MGARGTWRPLLAGGGIFFSLAVSLSSCAGTSPLSARRVSSKGTVASTTSTTSTSSSTTTTTTSSAPQTTALPTTTAVPVSSRKVTILEVGDSLGIDLGWGLQWALSNDPNVTVVGDAKGDTGLVNNAYYDWPAALQSELNAVRPQIVVVFLGANDVQGFDINGNVASFGTPAWKVDYANRVATMMNEARAANAKVVWVGEPIMQSTVFTHSMALVDAIFRKEAATHEGVTYFSSWPIFSTPSGAYNGGTTDVTGVAEPLRDGDGIHLALGGEDLLAEKVVQAMRTLYNLP